MDAVADAHVRRWRERVTDCSRTDRSRVEASIRICYTEAGRPPPTSVVWVDSPRQAARLADPRARLRLLERLGSMRPSGWRRLAGRRGEVGWSAARGAVLVGGLALNVGLVVIAQLLAGWRALPLVLVMWFAVGWLLYLLLRGTAIGDWMLGPLPIRSRWWRLKSVGIEVTLWGLLVGFGTPGTLLGVLVVLLTRRSEPGAGGTVELLSGLLAATAAGAALGLVVGALLGARRPSPRERSLVEFSAELFDGLRSIDEVPPGRPRAGYRAVTWHEPYGGSGLADGLGHDMPMKTKDGRFLGVNWLVGDLVLTSHQGRRGVAHRHAVAFADAGDAWRWWPSPTLVVACDRPAEMVLDPVVGPGGELRLHRPDGPALRWPDGTLEYWWHGVSVPPDLVAGRWNLRRILREDDPDVQLAAADRLGWSEFVSQARLRVVWSQPDPRRPGRQLRLYLLPDGFHSSRYDSLLVAKDVNPVRAGDDGVDVALVPYATRDARAAVAWLGEAPRSLFPWR